MGRKRKEGACELCSRHGLLTLHHLIPRTLHANKWFKARFDKETLERTADLCRDCHSTIHDHVSEKELGRKYHTVDLLRSHPEVGKYVEWVRTRSGRHRSRS